MYGNPGANEDDITAALKKANAERIIAKLAQGLETNVGNAGTQLSGGEK